MILRSSLLLLGMLQTPAPAPLARFHFQRADGAVKDWQIEWMSGNRAVYSEGEGSQRVPLQLSEATEALLLEGRFVVLQRRCETREKHVAQTSSKEIAYATDGGSASCVFNYSDEDALNRSAGAFQALAETVQIGEELARRHRFDRLGLDAEIDFLGVELKGERALEVENIAPVLQSIIEDDRVMERVRRKTARLSGQ